MSDVLYATTDQYRERQTSDAVESLLEDQILAASRAVDAMLWVAPGHFAPIDNATYIFDAGGGETLPLRDGEGLGYWLRTVVGDGIRPDYERRGTYDTLFKWDLDDVFIWPVPRNAAALGRPYRDIELRRVGDVPLSIWPYADGSVQIEGAWGWESIPPPIRELTIATTRVLRDAEAAGATAEVTALDTGLSVRTQESKLWLRVERRYSRKPIVAA